MIGNHCAEIWTPKGLVWRKKTVYSGVRFISRRDLLDNELCLCILEHPDTMDDTKTFLCQHFTLMVGPYSVTMRSAHSTNDTKIAGLPIWAFQFFKSVSVTPRAR